MENHLLAKREAVLLSLQLYHASAVPPRAAGGLYVTTGHRVQISSQAAEEPDRPTRTYIQTLPDTAGSKRIKEIWNDMKKIS
ncbi:hypothetical protein GHT09_006039 [Marmota monax]|uniref:Uncharacterized protein n=1 Tax=Marmota monax TaxID=9995 RepID=A0A834UNJ4_MARMO|nr:hypothetical protein GHT09_006039 [Marmota monax]